MNRIAALLFTFVLLFSVSCQRKELMDPHSHQNLIIKAHFEQNGLAQLMSNQSRSQSRYTKAGEPRTTKYIFYEKSTQLVAAYGEFNGLEGGVYLPEGAYDLLIYTSDFNELDANFYRGLENPLTAEAHTRQSITETSKGESITEMYMVEPDPTFSGYYQEIYMIDTHAENVVEVEMVQKSFKYYLTIKAKGLQNIHTAKMNISGMYTSAYLVGDGHREDESGIQTHDMDIKIYDENDKYGNGEVYCEFWAFGPHQNQNVTHSIILNFVNGGVHTIQLKDLTSQIKELTRGGEIIVAEQLEIKGPEGGGFQPEVGDWEDKTDVDIII